MKNTVLIAVLGLALMPFLALANGGVSIYDAGSRIYVSGSITDIAQRGEGAYLLCRSNLLDSEAVLYCFAKDASGNRASCAVHLDYAKASRIMGAINSSSSIRLTMWDTGLCHDLEVSNGSSYLNGFFR